MTLMFLNFANYTDARWRKAAPTPKAQRAHVAATTPAIRNQFLVEAAVLCVIGGGIGLALAKVAALAFVAYADFPAPIGFGVAVGAILFSAVIGLAFGGWPAIRASRLSPIEALRSE